MRQFSTILLRARAAQEPGLALPRHFSSAFCGRWSWGFARRTAFSRRPNPLQPDEGGAQGVTGMIVRGVHDQAAQVVQGLLVPPLGLQLVKATQSRGLPNPVAVDLRPEAVGPVLIGGRLFRPLPVFF